MAWITWITGKTRITGMARGTRFTGMTGVTWMIRITYYYIHTEKYSPKSYVVNFRTQISYSQSEERTMVFTREKIDTSNQNRERCFFTCEKNDTSNQKPQRCRSFAPKFPPFIAACSAASHTFIKEKSFTQGVFLAKKVKNISEMEWNSFVCFTVDKKIR